MSEDYTKYIAYFEAQASGSGGVGGNFKSVRLQRGNGIGSFFSGLFRKVLPYLKSGASAVGNELLNTGVSLLKDHLKGADPRTSIKERITNAGSNLGGKASAKFQQMLGLGYKKRKPQSKVQSSLGKRRKKAEPLKKTIKRKRDIFGF